LRIAMKYAPDYPFGYQNYAHLLQDMNMADKLEAHVKRALVIPGIDKSLMFEKLAVAKEIKREYVGS